MPEPVDPRHLLLIGAGPGVGAGAVRRFGREGFRSTLISRGEAVEQLASELRSDGLEIEAVRADIEDLDGYRATLERIFRAPGAPGVAVYNAAVPDPGEILDTTVGRLRTAYDVDVLGAVVAAQVAAPVLRTAGAGTLLFTSGGFADHPVPVLASLSMGKAALRAVATLIAAGVREDGIHAATITIAGWSCVARRSIRTTSRNSSGRPTPTRPTPGRPSIDSPARNPSKTPEGTTDRAATATRRAAGGLGGTPRCAQAQRWPHRAPARTPERHGALPA